MERQCCNSLKGEIEIMVRATIEEMYIFLFVFKLIAWLDTTVLFLFFLLFAKGLDLAYVSVVLNEKLLNCRLSTSRDITISQPPSTCSHRKLILKNHQN